MSLIAKILPWRRCLFVTLLVLLTLIILDFYGLYTAKFYFTKLDNYIFPLLSVIHFLYLYVIWFKITEEELPDPKMRNLEYALYALLVVYLFKIYDTSLIIGSLPDYQEHIVPETFFPIGVLILTLYSLLIMLALLSFWHRKRSIGVYNFENFNDQLNMWQ